MISLDKLISEWTEESKINKTSVHDELLRISSLHAKYLRYLMEHRSELNKNKLRLEQKRLEKREYYSGRTSKEKLQEKNLKPYKLNLQKSEISECIEADKEIQELKYIQDRHEEIIDACNLILRQLNDRTYQLRSFLEHTRYLDGSR